MRAEITKQKNGKSVCIHKFICNNILCLPFTKVLINFKKILFFLKAFDNQYQKSCCNYSNKFQVWYLNQNYGIIKIYWYIITLQLHITFIKLSLPNPKYSLLHLPYTFKSIVTPTFIFDYCQFAS